MIVPGSAFMIFQPQMGGSTSEPCGVFPTLSDATWAPNNVDTSWVTDHFEAPGYSQAAITSNGSVTLPHDVLVITVDIEVYAY